MTARLGRGILVLGMILGFLVVAVGVAPARADVLTDGAAAIDAYAAQPEHAEALGAPRGQVRAVRPGGAARTFTGGTVYYSPETGAHAVLGAIAARYRAVGGPAVVGFPTSDEQPAGAGRVSRFGDPGGAAIYWSPDTRASLLTGGVLRAWLASGAQDGPFGFPVSDTVNTGRADESRFAGPEGTMIAWSSTAGLETVPAELADRLPAMATAAAETTTPTLVAENTSGSDSYEPWWRRQWAWIVAVVCVAVLLLFVAVLIVRARRRRRSGAARTVAATHEERAPQPANRPAAKKPKKLKKSTRSAAPEGPAGMPVQRAGLVSGPPVDAGAEPPPESAPEPRSTPEPEPELEPLLSDETRQASALVITYDSADTAVKVAYENNALGADRAGDDDVTHAWLHGTGAGADRDEGEAADAEQIDEPETPSGDE
ncbi:LGFP repeat-containing protein [Gordonia iterans]